MLLMANIRDNKVAVGARLIDLNRGQMIASLNFLATRWKVSKERVRRYLKLLQSDNMIKIIHDGKATQITICNYVSYQDVRDDSETTTSQPRDDSETTTRTNIRNKEGKKERNNNKEKNKKESSPPSSPQGEISQRLSELILPEFAPAMEEWLQYKRKKRQTYKSDKSIAQCYNRLVDLSGGDPSVAMDIIHEAMANNWAGFFKLKNSNNHGNNGQFIDPQQARLEQYERNIREYVAGRLANLANEG